MKLFDDTHPEAEKVYVRLLSQAPPWKKMEIVNQLYLTAVSMARAGIRRRHPDADEDETRKRVARMFLGDELARKVYGPIPDVLQRARQDALGSMGTPSDPSVPSDPSD